MGKTYRRNDDYMYEDGYDPQIKRNRRRRKGKAKAFEERDNKRRLKHNLHEQQMMAEDD